MSRQKSNHEPRIHIDTDVARSREGAPLEDGRKRIRVYLGGEFVADSIRTRLVWELSYCPTYFFPEGDVLAELVPSAWA